MDIAQISQHAESVTFETLSRGTDHREALPIAMALMAFSLFTFFVFCLSFIFHNKWFCFREKDDDNDLQYASIPIDPNVPDVPLGTGLMDNVNLTQHQYPTNNDGLFFHPNSTPFSANSQPAGGPNAQYHNTTNVSVRPPRQQYTQVSSDTFQSPEHLPAAAAPTTQTLNIPTTVPSSLNSNTVPVPTTASSGSGTTPLVTIQCITPNMVPQSTPQLGPMNPGLLQQPGTQPGTVLYDVPRTMASFPPLAAQPLDLSDHHHQQQQQQQQQIHPQSVQEETEAEHRQQSQQQQQQPQQQPELPQPQDINFAAILSQDEGVTSNHPNTSHHQQQPPSSSPLHRSLSTNNTSSIDPFGVSPQQQLISVPAPVITSRPFPTETLTTTAPITESSETGSFIGGGGHHTTAFQVLQRQSSAQQLTSLPLVHNKSDDINHGYVAGGGGGAILLPAPPASVQGGTAATTFESHQQNHHHNDDDATVITIPLHFE